MSLHETKLHYQGLPKISHDSLCLISNIQISCATDKHVLHPRPIWWPPDLIFKRLVYQELVKPVLWISKSHRWLSLKNMWVHCGDGRWPGYNGIVQWVTCSSACAWAAVAQTSFNATVAKCPHPKCDNFKRGGHSHTQADDCTLSVYVVSGPS